MTFFQYLIKNGLWYFLGFIVFVIAFVYVSGFFGPMDSGEVKIIGVCLVVLIAAWVGGNWVAWSKLRK